MTESNGFVIAAYIVMWVAVLGYAIRLYRVFNESRRRLDDASRDSGGRTQ